MWFKVDDRLHDHRKARRIRRSHSSKLRDVAPFGLWVLAGSWAGANGTDGFVPTEVLEEWDDDATVLAQRLVDADLWWRTEQDGEPGYGFHDWDDMNPATERPTPKDASDSGTFGNHVRWHVNKGQTSPDCSHCDRGESPPDIAPNRQPESAESPSGIAPDPTRPDPTRETSATSDEFDQWYALYPRKESKGTARRAYKAARKKTDADTLLNSIKRAADAWRMAATDPKFIPLPATWLNGERWLDEVQPQPGAPRTDEHGQPVLPPPPTGIEWMS